MQKEKLLKLLQSEQNDIDAIGMILCNYIDFGHSELGGMVSVKQFETVAGVLLEWFNAKSYKCKENID